MELAEIPALLETLVRISGYERHGTVGGVEIDLRHELLDSSWTPMITLGISKDDDPYIHFPWSVIFERESNREPDCRVRIGDKIFIREVDRVALVDSVDQEHEHPHETELRLAYLAVLRANGTEEVCSKPIHFRGVSSIGLTKSRALIFNSISSRIDDFIAERRDDTRAMSDQLVSKSLSLKHSIDTRTRGIRNWVFMDGSERDDAYEKWALINDAIKLGYIWAKAETRFGLKAAAVPEMEVAANVRDGASRGGEKSGEVRREKRATTWERHARELACAIRAEQPELSQEKVAEEVSARWKVLEFDAPGHTSIKTLVSQMEASGDLPRRKRRTSTKIGQRRGFK